MIRGLTELARPELAWAEHEQVGELAALVADAVELTSLAAPIDLELQPPERAFEQALLATPAVDPRRIELGRATQALAQLVARLPRQAATERGARLRELLARILELRQAAGAQMSRISVG